MKHQENVKSLFSFQVRTACSCALGYLTYNAYAFRILLTECRNKPNQFLRIMNNISRDAKINPAFLKEFQMQQSVGLPSLRYRVLVRNGSSDRFVHANVLRLCILDTHGYPVGINLTLNVHWQSLLLFTLECGSVAAGLFKGSC